MSAHERDESSTLVPGYLVAGEYVVDEVSFQGAGWVSFRGHHVERSEELVAITALRADAPSAGYVEAFARRSQWLSEARIPNVPPLLSSGVEMGLPFIVTPWVDGSTLRELLEAEGSLSREEALRIIKAVGETLDAMHARKPPVIHQLLSLDNIRIDGITRAARVMDAGVAHALRLARVDDVHAAAKVPNVFRAPEDSVGRTPTAAVDRYALAKLAEALLSPIAPNTALARTLQRGHSDLAASRFSTCAAFVQALSLALKDSGTFTAPKPAVVASPSSTTVAPSTKSTAEPISGGVTISELGAASTTSNPSSDGSREAKVPTLTLPSATSSPSGASLASSTKATSAGATPPRPPPRLPKATLLGVAAPAAPPPLPFAKTDEPPRDPSASEPSPQEARQPTPIAAQPTASNDASQPPPRAASIPPVTKRPPVRTLLGMATPVAPSAVTPTQANAPEGAARVHDAPPSTNPFEQDIARTDRVAVDVAARDGTLDDEEVISVSDRSIIESVSDSLPAPPALTAQRAPVVPVTTSKEDAHADTVRTKDDVFEGPSALPAASHQQEDIGLAATLVAPASGPAASSDPGENSPPLVIAEAASTSVSSNSAVSGEDPFPPVPALDSSEPAASSQSVEVPPLFEVAPPVPTPISPEATSGMAPISLEKPRPAGRSLAIVAAVALGLAGGLGGGFVLFQRLMRGDDGGPRGVGSVASTDASGSEPVVAQALDTGQPPATSVAEPDTNGAVSDSNGTGATLSEDVATLVAQADDAAALTLHGSGASQDAGVQVVQHATEPSSPQGTSGDRSGVESTSVPGVFVIPGDSGLSSPNWRIRAGARRAVRERVEGCGADGVRGTARFQVRFEGSTGRVIQFELFNRAWRGTPVGECIERAMRSIALPPFNDRHWDTDYAVPLR